MALFRRSRVVFLLLAFIILSACQQQTSIATTPVDQTLTQKITDQQRCADITCGTNQLCNQGSCVCAPKFKACNTECISARGCCTENDCSDGQFCDNNHVCRRLPHACAYGETWNAAQEACTCVTGMKYCDSQNKCIPDKNCCTPADCTFRRDLCIPTSYVATICINDPTLHCKGIVQGKTAAFSLNDNAFKITVTNLLEQGNTVLLINNQSQTVRVATAQKLNDHTTISVDSIKDVGGVCKYYSR